MAEARYLILCNACLDKIPPERIDGIFLAKYGPVEGDVECSILACVLWSQRRRGIRAMPFPCDECGAIVSVARSSGWFVSEHRKERV